MNWSELIHEVAQRTGQSVTVTREVLAAFEDVAADAIAEGGSVRVPALGTLGSKWRKPRTVRSITDHQAMYLDGRHVPTFRPSAALRRRLEGLTPQNWREDAHQEAWRMADTLVDDLFLYHAHMAPAVDADADPSDVEAHCAGAFGPLWERVVSTYQQVVPAHVRTRAAYLGMAAQRRLAA
ncbi:MAG: HU family DNA-binding protein [Alphaproteobacteria bacterium]|nr:HU family DNA-binding protein [Alphaproteobacteria bacterium]